MTDIQPLTLTELSLRIQGAINQFFGVDTYWVIAEVSGHKFYPNNDRHYFDFIEKSESGQEPQAKIKGISWFQGSQSIKAFEQQTGQLFGNGLQVLSRVKVEYHPTHGLSLIVLELDVTFTLGNLEKQRRETIERLLRENPEFIKKSGDDFITTNNQSHLPEILQSIAIIGSPNSEGYTDFVHTILNNQYGYTFQLFNYQTSVQGAAAETEIISTLIEIHHSEKKYDCVVIIRGGGAKTDFLVFDSYRLARAVAKFPLPIITGIGHHKDVSIVDMMVHTNTKTPTKAAEFIISHNRNFEERLKDLQKIIIIKSQQLISSCHHEIHSFQIDLSTASRSLVSQHKDQLHYFRHITINQSKSLLFQHKSDLTTSFSQLLTIPILVTKSRLSELQMISTSIKNTTSNSFIRERERITNFTSLMKMMDPQNLLRKGFALVKQHNKILSGIEQVEKDSPLTIMLKDGTIETTIKTITPDNG